MAAIVSEKQKKWQLDEFRRRQDLSTLRKDMIPSVGEWWFASEAALSLIAQQFEQSTNHCVIDGFLGPDAAERVRAEVLSAQEKGLLDTAGVLGGGERGIASQAFENTEIRTDRLGWFDCTSSPDDSTCAFQEGSGAKLSSWDNLHYLLQRIETIVMELGRSQGGDFSRCHTRSRCMVTLYPGTEEGTSKYTKHYDNANKNGRRITAIYYMNPGWRRAHGGQLRLYRGSDTSFYVDVEPMLDRLVLFYSDMRCLHEVLPTLQDRYALTVWFFDRDERKAVLAKVPKKEDV